MFPKILDGAEVLFYTEKADFGNMHYTTGEIAAYFRYLAICKYENKEGYYLFKCNENIEVESDFLFDSIKECMSYAEDTYINVKWIKMI